MTTTSAPQQTQTQSEFDIDSQAQAARHAITHKGPSVAFTSGALLGNGGMGVVVCVRPDAIMLHFGHNDVWDIRLAENNRDAIGTFAEVFQRVDAIGKAGKVNRLQDDPWYAQYMKLTQENYRQKYPRPMPCGTVVLGLDRRRSEPLGYRLDISNGVCQVDLLVEGRKAVVELLVDDTQDRLWVTCADESGGACQPFTRVHVIPDPQTPGEFPKPQVHSSNEQIGFTQVLPRVTEPGKMVPGVDHSFCLLARLPGAELSVAKRPSSGTALSWASMGELERAIVGQSGLMLAIDLDRAFAPTLPPPRPMPTEAEFDVVYRDVRTSNAAAWRTYWNCSAVQLADAELERIWYRNLYFMRCAVRPGVTCPGLFANWSYREKGSSWHGDYHMNYNTQQPFWVTFSSNHLELNLPYVDMVEHLMPVSQSWARDYYQLRGAYFPHSAYPVPMTISPYPVPTWGWEICETPWSVQGLWWHYTYSMDVDFLRDRAFVPIREACRFLADYMLRPDARGERFGDDRYHVFPTVTPELYGLQCNFKTNYDVLADLTLIRFIFRAFLEACAVLRLEEQERELLTDIATVLEHFPSTPTADTPDGPVWVAAPDLHPEVVQNVPASTMTIFPGEEVGLHSSPDDLAMARRSLAIQQNEGGNELVFLNLQRVRAGVLDLEAFKRQVHYCTLPNGTSTDLALQSTGRYSDVHAFDFMAPMGIWFENFALPAVINECLMQSWDGIIHLFPNWLASGDAAFSDLRAVGAFLVSAQRADGTVRGVRIKSEAGGTCRVHNPWSGAGVVLRREASVEDLGPGPIVSFRTGRGETVLLERGA